VVGIWLPDLGSEASNILIFKDQIVHKKNVMIRTEAFLSGENTGTRVWGLQPLVLLLNHSFPPQGLCVCWNAILPLPGTPFTSVLGGFLLFSSGPSSERPSQTTLM
jgi:hypothetical protein